ncbi:hypothetical protein PspLS_03620 [Pyricularia sp. CBS 133598]|nr:hypothetical protein PspLS_03620 [Pyricularia sp. CBS 133598]
MNGYPAKPVFPIIGNYAERWIPCSIGVAQEQKYPSDHLVRVSGTAVADEQLPAGYDPPSPEMLEPTGAEYLFAFVAKALMAVKRNPPITEECFVHVSTPVNEILSEPGTAFRLVGNVSGYRFHDFLDWLSVKNNKSKNESNWVEVILNGDEESRLIRMAPRN